MKQRTFLVALLTALTTTLGLVACASSAQEQPQPAPTEAQIATMEEKPESLAVQAALDWADKNHSELAGQLLDKTLGAALFLDASYTTQVTENVEVEVKAPERSDTDDRVFTVPAEATSTFTVDKPVVGGTFTATLPVSLTVDTKLPLEEMVTGYSVANEDFSLNKE